MLLHIVYPQILIGMAGMCRNVLPERCLFQHAHFLKTKESQPGSKLDGLVNLLGSCISVVFNSCLTHLPTNMLKYLCCGSNGVCAFAETNMSNQNRKRKPGRQFKYNTVDDQVKKFRAWTVQWK